MALLGATLSLLLGLAGVTGSDVMSGRGPCSTPPGLGSAWCNTKLPIGQRVDALISEMTLAEKGVLISSFSKAIPRLNWYAVRVGRLDR